MTGKGKEHIGFYDKFFGTRQDTRKKYIYDEGLRGKALVMSRNVFTSDRNTNETSRERVQWVQWIQCIENVADEERRREKERKREREEKVWRQFMIDRNSCEKVGDTEL